MTILFVEEEMQWLRTLPHNNVEVRGSNPQPMLR